MALKRRGRWFDPALVGAMLGFRDDAAFWGPLEDPRSVPPVARWEPRDRVVIADESRLDRVAEAFARVIDAKSPYTARHYVFDALTADRPYREAMPAAQALEIVSAQRGGQLCPAAVAGLEVALAGEREFQATVAAPGAVPAPAPAPAPAQRPL